MAVIKRKRTILGRKDNTGVPIEGAPDISTVDQGKRLTKKL